MAQLVALALFFWAFVVRKGWQTARHCDFPQEAQVIGDRNVKHLLLKFDHPIKGKSIDLC